MALDHSQYHQLADQVLEHITETIDQADLDLDYEQAGNVLELECADDTQIIINKQEAMSQIWVATKFGGFHFSYDEGQWRDDRSGEELYGFLAAAIAKQGGERIAF
ncbi:iron donor protein CyaY [Ferrimonas balearica]|uniref:iron donor protein CyaY n=1 Tax=Ferrimonas balearica TaxID=44012 RepID=UPI001C99D2A5|nr:iron donor protein CyaY [Ferrimonas balearica]MBY5993342.1 iron donor protein CyaY [Ferrimonas balearica]